MYVVWNATAALMQATARINMIHILLFAPFVLAIRFCSFILTDLYSAWILLPWVSIWLIAC